MQTATLITGASNGIGAAIAAARRALGETVINLDRDPGGAADEFAAIDLADRAALAAVLDDLTQRYAITRVVNNAAIGLTSPVDSVDLSALDQTMAVNVAAPAQIVSACLPAMKAAGFGRILNIASRAALGKELRTGYAGSKGALISATRVWALELGGFGITANAIGPGPIETALFQSINPPDAPRTKAIRDAIPVGRMGQPQDIARAADYFLDDGAGFVTGQVLYVCGGMTVGVAPV